MSRPTRRGRTTRSAALAVAGVVALGVALAVAWQARRGPADATDASTRLAQPAPATPGLPAPTPGATPSYPDRAPEVEPAGAAPVADRRAVAEAEEASGGGDAGSSEPYGSLDDAPAVVVQARLEAAIDRLSERAMEGLRRALARRTAVEPGPSIGVDPATDEMAFYPVLYWPLTAATVPGPETLARLADYIANGGLLLIDTQSGGSGLGAAGAGEMRRIARALNLPPLAPVDSEHVLTRSFYLLDRFPGRWRGGRVWAEAPPTGEERAARAAGVQQFDRVDDNVSPVIVGSADWAAAWAVDEAGRALVPVGRPGGRQREMAVRFGVNLVMYALTGNYKSDQVHAPEVLRRLGQ